jgi:TonB family protein
VSASYRHSTYLPWYSASADEKRFQIIALVALIIALLLGTLVPMIELPEKERFKKQTLPPRLAKLILEQKKAPTKPKKIVKKKLPEPEKKKPEKKKPEVKKKPEPQKKPQTQLAKKRPTKADARKKAASAGLLAFSDQLIDLREEQIVTTVQNVQRLSTTGKKTYQSQRSVISSGVTSGSGGINTATLSRGTGGSGLTGRKTTEVESAAIGEDGKAAARGTGKGKHFKGYRTREEIQLVFDQNKGAVYALYNRALRKDPLLRGKVVLELTINPAGKVTKCVILSSELNDPKLERKLVSRIKLFKFPAKDVDTAVVSYPIDFLPS